MDKGGLDMTMIATGVGPSIKRERKKPEAWNEKNSERKNKKCFFKRHSTRKIKNIHP